MGAFKDLENKIAKQYMKAKGMGSKRAHEIGAGVAYKQGEKKYGKAEMISKALAGKKKK